MVLNQITSTLAYLALLQMLRTSLSHPVPRHPPGMPPGLLPLGLLNVLVNVFETPTFLKLLLSLSSSLAHIAEDVLSALKEEGGHDQTAKGAPLRTIQTVHLQILNEAHQDHEQGDETHQGPNKGSL